MGDAISRVQSRPGSADSHGSTSTIKNRNSEGKGSHGSNEHDDVSFRKSIDAERSKRYEELNAVVFAIHEQEQNLQATIAVAGDDSDSVKKLKDQLEREKQKLTELRTSLGSQLLNQEHDRLTTSEDEATRLGESLNERISRGEGSVDGFSRLDPLRVEELLK